MTFRDAALRTTTSRILVVGGYGAVGREAATMLARLPWAQVVVAGRHPGTTRPLPGTTAMRLDATDDADVARALDGVDAVLVCAELDDARLPHACVERGVDYVDVSASYPLLTRIEDLDQLARDRDATVVLSVGLVPGVTNLLARHCIDIARAQIAGVAGGGFSGPPDVEIGVLLGTGDRHGPAAIEWTLDALADVGPGWPMTFPPPHGRRAVHRFPFSDQYTLPHTLGVPRVRTGLCLGSRAITLLMLAAGGRTPLARIIARPGVRRALVTALARAHRGDDGFSVTASAAGATGSFSGHRQSRATGFAAALTARRLHALPSGVWHLDQVADPREFLTELAKYGFDLELDTVDVSG